MAAKHAHGEVIMAFLDTIAEFNKHASPFLRLPAELRLKIYEYVFAVPVIRAGDGTLINPRWQYSKSQLSILGVCSQIYCEARTLPFSVNVFRGWSGKVDRSILTYMRTFQSDSITSIRVYIDKMDIYRNPSLELRHWFIFELYTLSKFRQLKHLTLMWYDHRFEYVGQALFFLASRVLQQTGRHNIVLAVRDCDPCKAYLIEPDTTELEYDYGRCCLGQLAPHLVLHR